MNIFITGASGFVGAAAATHLAKQGHNITAMSRRESSDDAIAALGATPVRTDLDTISATELAGIDIVIHSAAFVEQWGPKNAWYLGNVVGTQNMLDAAHEAGVKRFIHIGTEAALVHGQHLDHVDETYPLAPHSPYPYCATKAQAEQRVREANNPQFNTIVLRPRFIWGPGDTTLLPTIEAMAKDGGWMWIDHGQAETSTTHVDNLVHAIELALTQGNGGEAYFVLDDGTRTLKDMVTRLAGTKGLALGRRSIPAGLASFAGRLCEGVWRLFNLKSTPPLTRHAAVVMSKRCTLDDSKARRELGYQPVISVDDGMHQLKQLNSVNL